MSGAGYREIGAKNNKNNNNKIEKEKNTNNSVRSHRQAKLRVLVLNIEVRAKKQASCSSNWMTEELPPPLVFYLCMYIHMYVCMYVSTYILALHYRQFWRFTFKQRYHQNVNKKENKEILHFNTDLYCICLYLFASKNINQYHKVYVFWSRMNRRVDQAKSVSR